MHVLDATSIVCTGVYVNLMGRCSTSRQHRGPGPGCGCSVTEKENAKRTIDAAENYSAVGYGKKQWSASAMLIGMENLRSSQGAHGSSSTWALSQNLPKPML